MTAPSAARKPARIAIVDPGSFVLPYDFQLVKALAARGDGVAFYGSTTRYNGEFLAAMRRLPGVVVHARPISRTVASRWRGAWAYLGLLAQLWRDRAPDRVVNLQFSGFWPAEWLVLATLRQRFVFTVHNAVPHGFEGVQHAPTHRLARLAHALVFVSDATRDEFLRRYGESFRAKSSVLAHGLLPVAPQDAVVDYAEAAAAPRALAFWGTVKPYKGVELFAALARLTEIRRRGLALQVHGAWAPGMSALRDELTGLGVTVEDRYLDTAALHRLLAQDAVFVLPYREASQSGALYALLNHGRVFMCADVGDLGAFMRRHGLEGLLLQDRSAAAVIRCLDHLAAHRAEIVAALQCAQQALGWERLLGEAGSAYRSA